jgi:hypothetical protein
MIRFTQGRQAVTAISILDIAVKQIQSFIITSWTINILVKSRQRFLQVTMIEVASYQTARQAI